MAHTNEALIKCPYCDYEHEDSWEYGENDGTTTCGNCERDFNVVREIEVTYSTSKIDCEEGKHDYQFESNHIFTRKFEKGEWHDQSEDKWKYCVIYLCTQCDKKEYRDLTKEEYFERFNSKSTISIT